MARRPRAALLACATGTPEATVGAPSPIALPMPETSRATKAALRWPFAALAYTCLGLAVAGVVLPGLPTVPFLLVAAWAASRGSDRLSTWIDEHRHFGPLLRDWREQRAIPRRAKLTGVALLVLSWTLILLRSDVPWLIVATGLFFAAMAVFLLSRPEPRPPRP